MWAAVDPFAAGLYSKASDLVLELILLADPTCPMAERSNSFGFTVGLVLILEWTLGVDVVVGVGDLILGGLVICNTARPTEYGVSQGPGFRYPAPLTATHPPNPR